MTEIHKRLVTISEQKYPSLKGDCASKRQKKIYLRELLIARHTTTLATLTDEQKEEQLNEWEVNARAKS